jgi:hypothetical protein
VNGRDELGQFTKGKAKTGGRLPGVQNRSTRSLKEALLNAAEKAGDGSLTNFLYRMAMEQPVAFLQILGKIIPLQLEGDGKSTFVITAVERIVIDSRDDLDRHPMITVEGSERGDH